ncbi:MAG: glycerophosphodiester phosphodiesterase family protein, partial [Pseudomonadota bacterium]
EHRRTRSLSDTAGNAVTAPGPTLVAHRGYAGAYPENSLPALKAAFDLGVVNVEVDVQVSADGEPFVLHDAELTRTAGVPGSALALSAAQLSRLEVNESSRLGGRFAGTRLPRLAEVLALVARTDGAHVFVELKRESIVARGLEAATGAVVDAIARLDCAACTTLISFDDAALRTARAAGLPGIGWVLPAYDDTTRKIADALSPDFLFCDHGKLPAPPEPLWRGPWRWVIYEVTTHALAARVAAQGATWIETMQLDVFVGQGESL